MGRGNQIIRGWDGETVQTYYFDSCGDFDAEKKAFIEYEREQLAEELTGLDFAMRRRNVEQMMMDGRLPVEVSDDRIYDRQNENVSDEIDNLSYEVAGIEGFARIALLSRESESVLVGGNNEYGQVIAESKHCQIVIGDNENSVALGCIPTLNRDNIVLLVEDDTELRAEDFQAEVDKRCEAMLELYKKDANAAMRKIHAFFGKQSISVRSGPWTSGTLKPYEELTEAERNDYY